MTQRLRKKNLKSILISENIENLSLGQLTKIIFADKIISRYVPDGVCQVDPRNGDRIVYNSARSRRPHDNRLPKQSLRTINSSCIICEGKTTQIIDVENLSEGFTFINQNLFPIFYPSNKRDAVPIDDGDCSTSLSGIPSTGFHLLQWTSSYHDKDWHNLPIDDCVIVMKRLAALEKKLLIDNAGYVSIIKNYGRLVGGSLAHGHQQISFSNIMPRRIRLDQKFKDKHGETFSSYLLRVNPPEFTIRDYQTARLVVPYFMRRPFDMQLIIKDPNKSHLYQLNDQEISDISNGWRDSIRIMLTVMSQISREQAFNITTHNGPDAGLYFEFLPYTQEMGGFEHLGLYSCQENQINAATRSRAILYNTQEKKHDW